MTYEADSTEGIGKLALLRALVATLGERTTPPWWRTQFLTDVGLRALARVFPRTASSAAVISTAIAAQADHDRRIGVGRRFHLFRLPQDLERSLSAALSEDQFRIRVAELVGGEPGRLLREIGNIANGRTTPEREGPVTLGPVARLAGTTAIEELASYYHASFETNNRALPYFEEGQGGA
jgi:hypothetical protein